MPTAANLPGYLALAFRKGDTYGTLVDFSINVTGHSWDAAVYSFTTGATVVEPTVSVVSAANGQVNVSLTHTQTAGMAAGTYGWRLESQAPGDVRRTYLQGVVEVAP
jgi:hypothetical protein